MKSQNMTAIEAGQFVGITARSLRRIVQRGELENVGTRRRVLVRRADVERLRVRKNGHVIAPSRAPKGKQSELFTVPDQPKITNASLDAVLSTLKQIATAMTPQAGGWWSDVEIIELLEKYGAQATRREIALLAQRWKLRTLPGRPGYSMFCARVYPSGIGPNEWLYHWRIVERFVAHYT
tara:strand:+ start:330 stop:869 length:540 start_codon:yes stop_codon:yes gene_type:complete